MKELQLDNFEKELLDCRGHRVVKFYSNECHLCVSLSKKIVEVESAFPTIKFFKVDILKEKSISDLFVKDGVPTLYYFFDDSMEEIPYPYKNPDKESGYRMSQLKQYLENKINNV